MKDDQEQFRLPGDDTPRSYGDDTTRDLVTRLGLTPGLPKDFKAEREGGSNVRLRIVDVNALQSRSGTVTYTFSHSDEVDTTTQAGLDAGRARAVYCGSVTAPGEEDVESTYLVTDTRYASGVFYCNGVNAAGDQTKAYLWANLLAADQILDSAIPDDVTHFRGSESGEEVSPGVVVSMVSFECEAPDPLGSFALLQLYLKDYTRLGSIEEADAIRYNGAGGGSFGKKVPLSEIRRKGTGAMNIAPGFSFVTVTGGNLLAEMKSGGGDWVEALGHRQLTDGVVDNGTFHLAAPWDGPSITAVDEWAVIPEVTVYGVSVSQAGTRRTDIENAPSFKVVLDGELSAPVAPTITGRAVGNAILIEFAAVFGTRIMAYDLFRGIGPSAAFADCTTHLDPLQHNANILSASTTLMQFVDKDFTTNEKETGQVFTYYVVTRNVRGTPSDPSTPVDVACRLDGTTDVDGNVPGRVGLKNHLFNAFFAGTAATDVTDTDTQQDIHNGTDASNLPGKPYGGTGAASGTGRFKGHTRWHSTVDAAASKWQFANGNCIFSSTPGAGGVAYCFQEIDAWDGGLGGAAGQKIPKDTVFVFTVNAKHNGTVPDGALIISVEQYKNNALTGESPMQYRDTSGNLQYYTGTSAKMFVPGSALLSTWQRFSAVFKMDSSLGLTRQIRVNIAHANSTQGGIYVMQPMFCPGETWAIWTGDMGDPSISTGDGDFPGPIGDRLTYRGDDGVWIYPVP